MSDAYDNPNGPTQHGKTALAAARDAALAFGCGGAARTASGGGGGGHGVN